MKRELFVFSVVEEFPKNSRSTFVSMICFASCMEFDPQKNFNKNFDVSVLPDPESPAIIIDCGTLNIFIFVFTLVAVLE